MTSASVAEPLGHAMMFPPEQPPQNYTQHLVALPAELDWLFGSESSQTDPFFLSPVVMDPSRQRVTQQLCVESQMTPKLSSLISIVNDEVVKLLSKGG